MKAIARERKRGKIENMIGLKASEAVRERENMIGLKPALAIEKLTS